MDIFFYRGCWKETVIILDNNIFKEIITTFDSFNFTVKEDEPLEKEVAVDPEMLGKVFENLLEKADRKSKGAFYTPRHIVHYMCQESLISYLNTNSDIPIEDLKTFITKGDMAINSIIRSNEKKKKYGPQYLTHIELPDSIKENSGILDNLLKKVKVIDPAVGSGAFPVGMMHEIVKARYILYLLAEYEDIKLYDLKRETIENSLYGVDIEVSATDVTKLRFWLSLIVDEENIKEIRPLPNLDNQIMSGNSLVDIYEDIKLFNEELIKRSGQQKLMITPAEKLFNDLETKKLEYFKTSGPQTKIQLKKEIKDLKWNFIEKQVERSDKPELLDEIRKYKNSQVKPFFIWELEFSEIFKGDNPGFDIVIGNPPYVSVKGIPKKNKSLYKKIYGISDDLYNYFFLKGFDILKKGGVLSFITSNTYLTIRTKINLRKLFQNNKILEIMNVDNVFKNAQVAPAIISFKKDDMTNKNYNFKFKNAIGNFNQPETYEIDINTYRNLASNNFFLPTKTNLKTYNKFNNKVNDLIDKWFDKIKTSKRIEKYSDELKLYRSNLKPGDITLLGLITEGGQGLITGNNGKFVGVLEGTKNASEIKKTRPKKLLKAIKENNINEYDFIKSNSDASDFLNTKNEMEIREIFDSLKEKYGKDIFGRGYIFKIIRKNEIADLNNLSEDEKKNGISSTDPHWVLYDKGDEEGNRWYLKTPFYIEWTKENVKFLKENGGSRFQNSRFYFREGPCWTEIQKTHIKSRIKENGVYSNKTMSLFSLSESVPNWYIVCILNSKFIGAYVDDFINHTQTFGMNNARVLPIVIPNKDQFKILKEIFNKAFTLKKDYFNDRITKEVMENELIQIQDKIDKEIYKIYDIDS